MKIALIYHKDPYTPNPRGGELSVRAIVEYLRGKGHGVNMHSSPWLPMIENCDLVLTWGKPASATATVCRDYKKKMVLMVRFWRNIAPLSGGVGNLMTRDIDHAFAEEKRHIFETASAIITNTHYARKVIERWQPVSAGKVHVSYVPILGDFEQSGDLNGKITVVTPEIYGENWLINGLAELMPAERFLVVNSDRRWFTAKHPNIEEYGYMDMEEVWRQTKVLLVPVYGNDICGTRRVTIEAIRRGIPVIASDACGMGEKLSARVLMRRKATTKEWKGEIEDHNLYYDYFRRISKKTWKKYDTPAQLEKFEQILIECTDKKC